MDLDGFPDPQEPGHRILGLIAARIVEDGSPAGFPGEIALGVEGEAPLWLNIGLSTTTPTSLRFSDDLPAATRNRVSGPADAWENAFAGRDQAPKLAGEGDPDLLNRLMTRFTESRNWLSVRAEM